MWLLSAHGTTDHLPPDVARDLEEKLSAKLHDLVAELVPDGHNGVAAQLTGDHVGIVNLAAGDGAPAPAGAPQGGELADGTERPAPNGPPPTSEELAEGEQTPEPPASTEPASEPAPPAEGEQTP